MVRDAGHLDAVPLEAVMRISSPSRKRLALAGALVLPASLLLSTSTATVSSAATTFRLVEKAGAFHFVDLPPTQTTPGTASVGDEVVITQRLFRHGHRVGKLHVMCTVTRVAANPDNNVLLCNGAYKLRRGIIAGTAITTFGQQNVHIAITGGTGRFAGVGGTATEMPGANGKTIVTFRLTR
jgi:hypothetical protein